MQITQKDLKTITILFFGFFAFLFFAEVPGLSYPSQGYAYIFLENGGKLEGEIIEETSEHVTIKMGLGHTQVSQADIREIEYLKGEDLRRKEQRSQKRDFGSSESSEQAREDTLEAVRRRNERYAKLRDESIERARRSQEHIVRFSDPSRIYANAKLNDQKTFPLLVDTGATSVVISANVARQLGYDLSRSTRRITATLADSSTVQGVPITLRSVKVAGLEVRNVEAVVIPNTPGHGLLGMSFLSKVRMDIDSERNKMILRRR